MKKETLVVSVFICCLSASCRHLHGNTNIHISESDRYYSMDAWFNENKTRNAEEYMDEKIGNQNNMSFVNTRMDGQLSLDDHTTFYIKKKPGYLEIRLDKNKNSEDNYQKIKLMCKGIGEVMR